MGTDILTTYLNDHIAGSVAAIELLEVLETLELGILGKLALWRAMGVAADVVPQIQRLDLSRLERRANEQHDRVEVERLKVARAAFGT
jgi:hypothetical protein